MTTTIHKLLERIRSGTFWSAVRSRIAPRPQRWIDRWHLESDEDCIAHLARVLSSQLRDTGTRTVLVIGDPGPARDRLCAALEAGGLSTSRYATHELDSAVSEPPARITTSCFGSRGVTRIARRLMLNESLKGIPFEYILSKANYEGHERYDRPDYAGFYFVSPLLQDDIDYLALYEESLTRFELKCDIRDYLDLCQLVGEVLRNRVPGDFVEFGSYKGHSGYLMARLLEAHGSGKKVHLFDTFESFPGEALGIDAFWSNTHPVSFDEVSAKLAACPNVNLVRGEFETTVPARLPREIAFAYVDCDSYRGTKYLMEQIYDRVLASGGLVAFEDYGHPALLGNRLAVDEFFEPRREALRWFSQFSGIYMVRKP